MLFLKFSDARRYQWIALLGLPILVAMGVEVSFRLKDAAGQSALGLIVADFEGLQYLFAAVLAAFGGFFGLVVVAMASLVKFIRFANEFSGLRILHPGSIGEAAALLSIAHLFGQKGRLESLLTTKSISVPGTLFLIVLCTISIATAAFSGLTLTTWPYVFLLLSAFYYGLSSIQLLPGIVIVGCIGLVSTLLHGFVDRLHDSIDLMRLLSSGPEDPMNQWYKSVVLNFVLPSPFSTLSLIYVALLGRGLRRRWLSQERTNGVDDLAYGVTSLSSLTIVAVACILLWDFSAGLFYGHKVTMPENESFFQDRFVLISSALFYYLVPFVAFCLGALYGGRAVGVATLCFLVLIVTVHFGLALKFPGGSLGSPKIFADAIKLTYSFNGINIGRGLVLPLYAILGMAVSRRSEFFRQPAD